MIIDEMEIEYSRDKETVHFIFYSQAKEVKRITLPVMDILFGSLEGFNKRFWLDK